MLVIDREIIRKRTFKLPTEPHASLLGHGIPIFNFGTTVQIICRNISPIRPTAIPDTEIITPPQIFEWFENQIKITVERIILALFHCTIIVHFCHRVKLIFIYLYRICKLSGSFVICWEQRTCFKSISKIVPRRLTGRLVKPLLIGVNHCHRFPHFQEIEIF